MHLLANFFSSRIRQPLPQPNAQHTSNMPKSKRARVVHTSQVQKKAGKERSQALFQAIHEAIEQYQHVFVFSVENMRNNYLKDIRQAFSDSRLFFGKTKVMAKALGSTAEDEQAPGIGKLTNYLKGSVGLFCTNQSPSDIIAYFDEYVQTDFARAGAMATETITVPSGVVYSTGGRIAEEEDIPLPHSQEAQLRKWGMPTRLDKGRIKLEVPYLICKEGKVMNSDQTALLKLFGIATAEFRLRLLAYWSAGSAEVTALSTALHEHGMELDSSDDADE